MEIIIHILLGTGVALLGFGAVLEGRRVTKLEDAIRDLALSHFAHTHTLVAADNTEKPDQSQVQ